MKKIRLTFTLQAPTTPAQQAVYMASSVNDWKARDPKFAFKRTAPGTYQLAFDVPAGTVLEYKFTRGNWRTVEVDAEGVERENRRLTVFGETTVAHEVPHWKDQASPHDAPKRTRKTDVRVLPPFHAAALNRDVTAVIYLPPGYDEAGASVRYPVLYMWDGQNLMDPATAFNHEWAVDAVVEKGIKEGRLAPMIVVGIYNGGEHRLSELSPWRDMRLGARGEGHAFFRWVVTDLKDHIDRHYRTLTGPEHTGVAGSSMGGLASLYCAYRYPLVFGRVAAMSPAFWFARLQVFRYAAETPPPVKAKIYLDCGEKETARVHPKRDFYKVAFAMVDLLKQQGFREGENLKWVSDPQGTHSEPHWARRLGPALEFLFPGPEARG